MRTTWKHYGPETGILDDPTYPRATFRGVRAIIATPCLADPAPAALCVLEFYTGKARNLLEFPPNVLIPVDCEPGEEMIIQENNFQPWTAAGVWCHARLSVLSEDSD